jgi:hypothetical protein
MLRLYKVIFFKPTKIFLIVLNPNGILSTHLLNTKTRMTLREMSTFSFLFSSHAKMDFNFLDLHRK